MLGVRRRREPDVSGGAAGRPFDILCNDSKWDATSFAAKLCGCDRLAMIQGEREETITR